MSPVIRAARKGGRTRCGAGQLPLAIAPAPDVSTKEFSGRLATACSLRNVGGTMDRVALLMRATGCGRRTALRWLSGGSAPRHGEQIVRISAALDVDAAWLTGVANQSPPMLAALVRKFSSLTPEMQIEAVCFIDRLAIDVELGQG